jgi:diguanylate cyclase (GGDEF)-like protein
MKPGDLPNTKPLSGKTRPYQAKKPHRGLLAVSLLAAVAAVLLLWHHSFLASPLWIWLVLGSTAFLSYRSRQVWQQLLWGQKETSNQLALLVSALQVLSTLPSRDQVLRAMPELLEQQAERITVWLPQIDRLQLYYSSTPSAASALEQSVAQRAYVQGSIVYEEETEGFSQMPNTPRRPRWLQRVLARITPGPGRQTPPDQQPPSRCMAIPLFEHDEVAAVVCLKRRRDFQPREQVCFDRFAKTVSNRLTWIAEQAEARLLHQLSISLAAAGSVKELAERALVLLASGLNAPHGVILQQQGQQLRTLAQYQAVQTPGAAWSPPTSASERLFWKVYHTGQAVFVDNLAQEGSPLADHHGSLAVHPITLPNMPRARVLLGLAHPQPHRWKPSEQNLLNLACRSISLALEGALARQRLETVLDLSHQAALDNSESLYQQVLNSAVELIPGAEAGSLLVRQGERFHFKAAVGYDLEHLKNITFTEQNHQQWYGANLEGWYRGEPRILSNEWASIEAHSVKSSSAEAGLAAYTRRIQSNLAIPVLYQGHVLALLNLDSFHDTRAFGQDSLEVARFFVTPVATLLHQAHTRQSLAEAALTDSLTGLANRRAFNAFFDEELALAKRYRHPFSLLLMDLQGFKAINDQLGHALGDEALVRVAEALKRTCRESDGLFRFGGDEFAAVLPYATEEQALHAAQRYARAIQEIGIRGCTLGVNIGVATYPLDGSDKETLLRMADERMYAAKERRLSVLQEPGFTLDRPG